MLNKDEKKELLEKIEAIKELNEVIVKNQKNIESVNYEVYAYGPAKKWAEEFLVINYKGGARSIKRCNMDSFSAIFEEISKLLVSGYYGNEEYYTDFISGDVEKLER